MGVDESTPKSAEEVSELPRTIQARILRLLVRLESWPSVSGAKPLRGKHAGSYRMRTGDYRLQFKVDGDTVIVDHIGHRDGFYED